MKEETPFGESPMMCDGCGREMGPLEQSGWDGADFLCGNCFAAHNGKRSTRPIVVYTAGVWDLLHRGHLNFLYESKQLGHILVVGVVSDKGTEAYKGEFPAQHSQHRLNQIQGLRFVDVVEVQQTTDPTPLLERYRPDIMTHGDDWPKLKEGHETLERLGIEWRLIPYTEGISSTDLRNGRNAEV